MIMTQQSGKTVSHMDDRLNIKCWDIYMADIPLLKGSRKQCGLRPVLILSNDNCLKHSDYITVIPFTTKVKRLMPTHLFFNDILAEKVGLKSESVLVCEQINGLDTKDLRWKIGSITDKSIQSAITRKALIQMLGNYDLNYISDEFLNHPF